MISLNICAFCIQSTMICLKLDVTSVTDVTKLTCVIKLELISAGPFLCPAFVSIFTCCSCPGLKSFHEEFMNYYHWYNFYCVGRPMVHRFRSFCTIANVRAFSIKTIRVRRTYFPIVIVRAVRICTIFTFIDVQANCWKPYPFNFIDIIKSMLIIVSYHCIKDV